MSENPAIPRLAFASVAGTALEYYDFAVYNTLAALVFNQIFFPSFDPMTGTILSFATFGVGYARGPSVVCCSVISATDTTPLRAGDDTHHDGHHHRAHRPAADLCADRCLGAGTARFAALPARHGARR
jgi:hypothetical protein